MKTNKTQKTPTFEIIFNEPAVCSMRELTELETRGWKQIVHRGVYLALQIMAPDLGTALQSAKDTFFEVVDPEGTRREAQFRDGTPVWDVDHLFVVYGGRAL